MSLVNRTGCEHECNLCGAEWTGAHPPDCDSNKGRPCTIDTEAPFIHQGLVVEFLSTLKGLPRADVVAFLDAFGVASVRDIKNIDGAAAILMLAKMVDAATGGRPVRKFFPQASSAMQAQIDEARDVAACLVHAYDTDNRPPREAAEKARTWLRRNIEAVE